MASSLENITIRGFKSIRSLDSFQLNKLNVLVGANGAGKSNFVDFFRMLRSMADKDLQGFVGRRGNADTFFFGGPKLTPRISAHLKFGQNEYRFDLDSTNEASILVANEECKWTGAESWRTQTWNKPESGLRDWHKAKGTVGHFGPPHYVVDSVSSWTVYHFHDTSDSAPVRRPQGARDFRELHPQAGNIAPFLLRLRETDPGSYARILYNIQFVAPYLDDFILEPDGPEDQEKVRLEWKQKGVLSPMQPYQLSDGTLRFICLATALIQPSPPATILIDEPELGLHPAALDVLAGLMREASYKTQIIVSTQSATLLDLFEPNDVVVVDRKDGASTFVRLEEPKLREWLNDFTLGDVWRKNVFAGGPFDG